MLFTFFISFHTKSSSLFSFFFRKTSQTFKFSVEFKTLICNFCHIEVSCITKLIPSAKKKLIVTNQVFFM